ncbi:Putative Ring finger domain protein [Rhizopus microsporus]|nr:Putative Ring finger domain protein [Rhizopus microsporus]
MPLFEKVGMHWHLWRIRRRQRALYESGVIDMGAVLNTHSQSIKKVIDPASLSLFPTRIIDAHNQEEAPISNSNQEGDLENNDQPLHHESHEQVCVICLDEFSTGEQVRKLPCSHEFHTECIDPWLTIKSASCPLCKHDCYVKTETNDAEQSTSQPTPLLQPPRSSSPFFASLRPSSRSPSPAFGPTIPADRAEEFSRSWMARSLPRNMRRQIHEAAQAAAAAHQETVIELPARMTQPVEDLTIPVPPPPTAAASVNNRTRLTNRFKDSLPRFLRSV